MITLAEVFRDNGYSTGFFGTWKNGRNWPSNAQGQGFERVSANAGGEVLEFVREQREQPFFCWLSLPAESDLEVIDSEFARVLLALAQAGKSDNTVVIFSSATAPGTRQREAGDQPPIPRFYGDADSVHEAGVRVPFLVRWPDRIPAAVQTREISAAIDLLPTLVDLCGLTFVETLEVDGISLAELLLTGGEPRRWPNRLLFTSFTPPGFKLKEAAVSVRTGRWLAVKEPRSSRAKNAADRDRWELYDKHADPYQRYNVAEEYWSLAGHLSADFAFWMKRTTENGLAPIAQEIGHPEWPVVVLHREDAIYDGDADDDGTLRWPVEVVANGKSTHRLQVDGAIIELLVRRGEAVDSVDLGTVDGGLPITLDRKVTELEVKTDRDSLQMLRLIALPE